MKKCIALCLSLMMVLSCCGMAASAEERYLGVMLSTNIMSLDTNLATDGESFEVIADCVDGLMQMDADGAAIPALAESYDLSEDGKTYTFHLRDAKWSNGTPVTAADFVFAWRRICKEAGEYPTITTFLPSTSPRRSRMENASNKPCVGCSCVPSPALITRVFVRSERNLAAPGFG